MGAKHNFTSVTKKGMLMLRHSSQHVMQSGSGTVKWKAAGWLCKGLLLFLLSSLPENAQKNPARTLHEQAWSVGAASLPPATFTRVYS